MSYNVIVEKSFDFAVRIVNLRKYLTREYKEFVLSKQLLSSKLTSFTATAGEGQYFYYCLPKRMGKCIFTVGVLPGGFNLVKFDDPTSENGYKETFDFKNSSGYTEPYYIYRSNNSGLGTKTVNVS